MRQPLVKGDCSAVRGGRPPYAAVLNRVRRAAMTALAGNLDVPSFRSPSDRPPKVFCAARFARAYNDSVPGCGFPLLNAATRGSLLSSTSGYRSFFMVLEAGQFRLGLPSA